MGCYRCDKLSVLVYLCYNHIGWKLLLYGVLFFSVYGNLTQFSSSDSKKAAATYPAGQREYFVDVDHVHYDQQPGDR